MGVMDRYNIKKKEKEESHEKELSSIGGVQSRYEFNKSIGTSNYEVNDEFINKFFSDAKFYLGSAEEEYSSIGFGNASSIYDARYNTWKDLYSKSNSISKWLENNKDKIKEDTYKSLSSSLSNFQTRSASQLDLFKMKKEYYSQWDSEESYNAWVTNNDNRIKYDSMTIDELKAEKERRTDINTQSVSNTQNEIAKLQEEKAAIEKENEQYSMGQSFSGSSRYQNNLKRIRKINMQIDELNRQISVSEKESPYVLYRDDQGDAVNIDTLIQIKSAEDTLKKIESTPSAKVTYDALVTNKEDIDTIDKALATVNLAFSSADAYTGLDSIVTDDDKKRFEYLSEKYGIDFSNELNVVVEELDALRAKKANDKDALNSTFESQGFSWEALDHYNKWIESKENAVKLKQKNEQYGIEHPIAATIFSILAAPTQIIDYAGNIADSVKAAGSDEYSPLRLSNIYDDYNINAIKDTTGAVSNLIGEKVLEKTGSEFLSWLSSTAYSGVTSSVQSAVTNGSCIALFGPEAGAAIALGIQASEAAASQFNQSIRNGSTNGEALTMSVAAGAAEALFEKIPLDRMMKNIDMWDVSSMSAFIESIGRTAKGTLYQGLTEAFEETGTSLSNFIADGIINGDHSEYNNSIRQYIESGMSRDEAAKMAAKDFMVNLLGDAVGGFIGGFSHSGVTNIANTARGAVQLNENIKNSGEKVLNSKIGGVDALKALANDVAGVNKGNSKRIEKLANKVTSDTSGKNVRNVGKLSTEIDYARVQQNTSDIKKALVEKGLTEKKATEATNELMKAINKGEFSKEQLKMIENTPEVKEVLQEVVFSKEGSVAVRNAQHQLGRIGIRVDEKGNVNKDDLDNLASNAQQDTAEAAGKSSDGNSEAQDKSILNGEIHVINDVDVTDRVSDTGNTVQTSTGESISINKENAIAKIETVDGERVVYFNTDKGIVPSSDVAYSSESEGLLYESFVDMNPAYANSVIKNYDGKMPVKTYINGMREGIILYGMHHFQGVGKDISKDSFLAALQDVDQAFALKLGSSYAESVAKKQGNALREAREKAEGKPASKGRVTFEQGVVPKGKLQKRAVSLAKHLASAMGINIVFYDARTTMDIEGKGANGYYDPDTNTIHLDLQNSTTDAKTIAFTLSHELTHFIKEWSQEKFDTFAKFLMEQYAEHGVSTSQLLANKMAELGTNDADFAYEEMICDACETMLLDSDAVTKLMELRQTDLELFDKIKLHIRKLLNKIRDAYRKLGLNPTSDEAKALLEMKDVLDKIHALFEEAAVDAVQNYQAVQSLDTDAVSVTEDGTIMMQMKQYQQTGRATLLNYLRKQYGNDNANDLISTMDNLYNTMAELKKDTTLSVFGNWQEQEVELDENGHPIFTTSINNGDYELNQDFSRVCKKRRQLNFVLNMLAEDPAFEASNLTKEDFVKINKAIKEHGFEIACALCFVDSKRFRQSEWADSFANTWNDILNSMKTDSKPLSRFNFATKSVNISDDGIEIDTSKPITFRKWSDGKVSETKTYKNLDDLLKREGNANVKNIAKLIRDNATLRHEFRGADIIASDGFDMIQRLAPDVRGILDGWGGTSVPKPSSNDAIYDNSVLNIKGYNAEKAFAIGGVRMNSFSDFMAHMFFDYAQAFADLSAKKLPMHSYTKELDFARLFGLTKGKINMSAIAAIRENATDLDTVKGQKNKDAVTEYEKSIAGLDISKLADKLGKAESDVTYDDVIQNLDDCEYVWADESIDVRSATLLQSGIMYDNLTDGKAAYCYELIKEGKFEEAFKVAGEENVNREYAKHLGIITVGVSKAHILKLLRDPTIRMVIPYHKSGLNGEIAKALKIAFYEDFTDVQNTSVKLNKNGKQYGISSKSAKDNGIKLKDFNFYDYFGKTIDGVFYDGKATATKYIEWCKNGVYDESVGDYVYYLTGKSDAYVLASDFHKNTGEVIPKFADFAEEENYYKVIEDFDCYDTITGEHSPQEAVDFFHDGLPADHKAVLQRALKAEQKVSDDFKDHLDNQGLRDEIMEIVKAHGYKPSVKKQAKPTKRNAYDYSKSFEEQIDDYKKGLFPQLDTLIVSGTPEVWQKVGFNALPVTINQTHVDYALNGTKDIDHFIGEKLLKDLPNAIQNPIAIIQSQSKGNEHRAVIILEMDHNGKKVISAIEVDGKGVTNNIVIDSNAMTSVFAKGNALTQLKNAVDNTVNGNVELFYWNKKEAVSLLQKSGLQLSGFLPQDGFIHSIHESGSKVNTKFNSVVETQQFKRWFGDWQKNPKKASKVVNKDGTPRVVYHYTNADFWVFDTEKSGSNQGKTHGDGIYISTSPTEFAYAGKNRMELYANIRNPFEMQLTDEQAKYVLEKYAATKHDLDKFNGLYRNHAMDKLTSPTRVFDYLIMYAEENGIKTSDILKDLKFDGVHDGSEWVAFDREQLKSATDNIGTFDATNPDIRYQQKRSSNRAILSNALESAIDTSTQAGQNELKLLKEYQSKIETIEKEEAHLAEVNSEIREISFGKGKDRSKLKELQQDKVKSNNRLNTLDKQLLKLEAMKPIKDIIAREKEMVRKRTEEKGREALKEASEKVRETRDKRDAKAKLQKLVLDTSKWLSSPSKNDVKCPDVLKGPYAKFLNSIDLSSKRLLKGGAPTKNDLIVSSAIESLANAIDRVLSAQDPTKDTNEVFDSGYLDLPEKFVNELRDTAEKIKSMMVDGDYVVNQMSSSDIRKLSQMIRTLNHSIKEISTLYSNMRFSKVNELGAENLTFLDSLGKKKSTTGVGNFIIWDNALPYYVFKRFGNAGVSIMESLMDAQDKLAFNAYEIFKFKEKTWTDKQAIEWSNDTHTIDLPSGGKLTLTTADAMSIYCLSRRDQAKPHLLQGGVRVIGKTKGTKTEQDSSSHLKYDDIRHIISTLSAEQIKVANAIQEFMSTVCADWGNEIFMKRFLTKEFTEKFYFPIESNDQNLNVQDPKAQHSDLYRLLNISATKALTRGANNQIVIRNIFDVFTNHSSDMARLNAYGMALLDYMKWLNYKEKTVNDSGEIDVKSTKKSMDEAYGDKAFQYVLNLIKDINGRYNDGGENPFLMKMTRTAKTAMVGANLRVAALQMTAYPRAAMVLSVDSLAKGLTKVPKIQMAQKYCGIALWKSFGFYDTNIARSIEEQIKGTKNVRQKLIELSLKGAEWGDAITWGCLWNACEYEVAKTKKYKVGTEEFYQAVGKKLREVVYATQVVDSTLTRSQIMRSKSGLTQGATAFMSEPTLSANILMDAGFQFSIEKRRTGSAKAAWKLTGKYITKTIAVYSAGQLLAAVVEGLMDAFRDDDDDEFKDKFLKAFKDNAITDLIPFNKLPIVADLFEVISYPFGIGYFDGGSLYLEWAEQAITAYNAWEKVLSGNETGTTVYNAIYNTTKALSSMSGLPGGNLMREAVALWNNTAGASDITLKVKTYERTSTELGQELYEAIVEGDTKQAESLREEFEDENAVTSAIRKAIKENDPRITEAGQALFDGDNTKYEDIVYEIIDEGNFSFNDVVAAVQSVYNDLKPDEESGAPADKKLFNMEYFFNAIANGDSEDAEVVMDYMIEADVDAGKTMEEAEKEFNSDVKTRCGNEYKEGTITESKAKDILITYGGKTQEEATNTIRYWDFEMDYPDLDVSESAIIKYFDGVESTGISIDVFAEFYTFYNDTSSDVDVNGKAINGSKKAKVMAYINSLPISNYQKDALYLMNYKQSTIGDAPWH